MPLSRLSSDLLDDFFINGSKQTGRGCDDDDDDVVDVDVVDGGDEVSSVLLVAGGLLLLNCVGLVVSMALLTCGDWTCWFCGLFIVCKPLLVCKV